MNEVTQEYIPSGYHEKITSVYLEDCLYEQIDGAKKKQTMREYFQEFKIPFQEKNAVSTVINYSTAQGEVELEFTQQENMHYHTENYGLTQTPYIDENQFLENIEKFEYLVIILLARKNDFKESDLDTLAFIVNLFNHTFNGPRLVVKQIKNEQNSGTKKFNLLITQHYLVNRNQEISKVEFFEIVQEIQFMTFVHRMINSLFQSLESDLKKQTKDYTIDDLIIKNFENNKKAYQQNLKEKSQKVEDFQKFLDEQGTLYPLDS